MLRSVLCLFAAVAVSNAAAAAGVCTYDGDQQAFTMRDKVLRLKQISVDSKKDLALQAAKEAMLDPTRDGDSVYKFVAMDFLSKFADALKEKKSQEAFLRQVVADQKTAWIGVEMTDEQIDVKKLSADVKSWDAFLIKNKVPKSDARDIELLWSPSPALFVAATQPDGAPEVQLVGLRNLDLSAARQRAVNSAIAILAILNLAQGNTVPKSVSDLTDILQQAQTGGRQVSARRKAEIVADMKDQASARLTSGFIDFSNVVAELVLQEFSLTVARSTMQFGDGLVLLSQTSPEMFAAYLRADCTMPR